MVYNLTNHTLKIRVDLLNNKTLLRVCVNEENGGGSTQTSYLFNIRLHV